MNHFSALVIGFILDLILGDPYSLPHPVRGIGRLISKTEGILRKKENMSPKQERIAGAKMMVIVSFITVLCGAIVIFGLRLIHPVLGFVAECIICYQMLAVKSLRTESMKVHHALNRGSLEQGRKAVSMIVGRDTENLTEEEVAAAAVETVAESTSDGIVAPIIWMAILGPLGGLFYKSINTMDSMVGYKNDKYMYFGTVPAITDDVVNFIPARIAGVIMCIAAKLGFDAKGAWRIFLRDRKNHNSPNSAHTEAACAGALGLRLGGTHIYFGKPVYKPTIGDPIREIEVEDIRRANNLTLYTSVISVILFAVIPWIIIVL